MAFVAGQRVRAADLNRLGGLTGRNSRTSNITGVSTVETSLLSVRAPVLNGRSYQVTVKGEFYWVTSISSSEVKLRYTTNDVEPTTSSTLLDRIEVVGHNASGIPVTGIAVGVFDATSTGFLRVLATLARANGTGTVSLGAGAGFPMVLTVEDVGDTIASSGTVY